MYVLKCSLGYVRDMSKYPDYYNIYTEYLDEAMLYPSKEVCEKVINNAPRVGIYETFEIIEVF